MKFTDFLHVDKNLHKLKVDQKKIVSGWTKMGLAIGETD